MNPVYSRLIRKSNRHILPSRFLGSWYRYRWEAQEIQEDSRDGAQGCQAQEKQKGARPKEGRRIACKGVNAFREEAVKA
jgi:hypothetical protein